MPLSEAERDAYLHRIEATVEETRDLARSTDQTMRELIVPALSEVKDHSRRLDLAEGAVRLLGYLGAAISVGIGVLAFVLGR